MPIARFIHADRLPLLRLHLARLGIESEAVEAAARRIGGHQVLVTGAKPAGLRALGGLRDRGQAAGVEDFPLVVLGDRDRAMGTAFLSGRREQFERLTAALLEEGPEASLVGRALAEGLARMERPPPRSVIGGREFAWGTRTFVMGVLNVTPDSFSDGGRFLHLDQAVTAGERMAAEGADIIDVGGESTRPGAADVPASVEIDRVVPVIAQLARRVSVPISVDTTKAEVAEAALRAGASLVNDISGFKFDLDMASTVARFHASACVMHIQGTPRTMQHSPQYFDVVGEVAEYLQASLDYGEAAGIPLERLLVDPGIGFGKTAEHNLFLLQNLAQLRCLGRPLVVGVSRKSFIGKLTGAAAEERLAGSLAALSAAVLQGADMVRVHDVAASVQAVQILDAVARADAGGFAFLS